MKVLIVAQYFPPDMGGGATRAYNVAKGLMMARCAVIVVSAFPHYPTGNIPEEYRWNFFKAEWFKGIRVVRTFVPPLASKGMANRMILFLSFIVSSLVALVVIGKVDVIWAANPNVLSIVPALVIGLFKRCPIALNVDDLWPEDLYSLGLMREGTPISAVAEFLARVAYWKAGLITPISPAYVRVIAGKYGVNPTKIHVVKAGVDTETFKPRSVDQSAYKEFTVLYSGAFSVAYDFDQVLMAASLVEKRWGGIKFVIQGVGELAEHIKYRAKELKLNCVTMIDEAISREMVAELLCTADALILPLRDFGRPYLGISSKLYEYQATGKPIVCCAEGEPAKYVRDTMSGLVVKPGDCTALAEVLLYLRDNPDICKRLGANGRRYVEENLSIDRIGAEMVNLLRALARAH